jgi:PleD family two-component response regulator
METPKAMTILSPKRVLIADDSADDREMVRRFLPKEYVAREAATEAEAMALFEDEDIYFAFVDVFFEDGDQRASGIALGQRLAERIPVSISDKEDRTQMALRMPDRPSRVP